MCKHTTDIITFEVNQMLATVGVNPMATFCFKGNGFFLTAGYVHSVNLSEPTTTLVNNDNTVKGQTTCDDYLP